MKTSDRIPLFWILLLTFVFVMIAVDARATKPKPPPPSGDATASSESRASVGDVSGGNASVEIGGVTVPVTTGNTGNVTGGDVSVGGDSNKAFALSNNLGDVDIAGCLGSTQWGTPVFSKQKLVINWPCLAEFYLRNGLYENAAMAICNTEVRQEFETEKDCRDAHPFKTMAQPAPAPTESSDEDEEHRQLEAELASLRADVATYKEKSRKATLEARYAVREAQKHPETVQYALPEEQLVELQEWEAKWGKK